MHHDALFERFALARMVDSNAAAGPAGPASVFQTGCPVPR